MAGNGDQGGVRPSRRDTVKGREMVIAGLVILALTMVILPFGWKALNRTKEMVTSTLARNVYLSVQTVMLYGDVSGSDVRAFTQRFAEYRLLEELGRGENEVERQLTEFSRESVPLDIRKKSGASSEKESMWGKAGGDYEVKLDIAGGELKSVTVRTHPSKKFARLYDGTQFHTIQ